MSDNKSSKKNYKAIAQRISAEKKTLQDQMGALKTKHDLDLKTMTDKKDDYKKQLKTKTEECDALAEQEQETDKFINDLYEKTGKDDHEDVLAWVDEQAEKESNNQVQQDAIRMLGELQVKFNLLSEQMDEVRKNGFKVSKSKKAGFTGRHRGEDVQDGVLKCFQANHCCAISWSDGQGGQCSRHWDKNDGTYTDKECGAMTCPNGEKSKMCKTHAKLITPSGTYEGAFGLYSQKRPTKWGEFGLKVQNEFKKDANICWKLKAVDYDAQIDDVLAGVPDSVPKYLFPDQTAEAQMVEFSSDEEDEGEDDGSNSISEAGDDVGVMEDVESEEEQEQELEEDMVALDENGQIIINLPSGSDEECDDDPQTASDADTEDLEVVSDDEELSE